MPPPLPHGRFFDAHFDAERIVFGPLLFHAARSLRDLGFLTAVESKPLTVEEVASRCNVPPGGARILLDAGVAAGALQVEDNRFGLSRVGHLLLHDEMTRTNMDFVADVCYAGAAGLTDALNNEKPAGLRTFGTWDTVYQALPHLPEQARRSWFRFDHFYSDAAFPECVPIVFERKPARILDVGGNTGKWAVTCATKNPDVRVTILDHPGQLDVALRAAVAAGFSGRITGEPMDLLDHRLPFPNGFDAVWMSQFLDCFAHVDAVQLLRRGRQALAPNGRLYVLEPLRDRQPNAIGEFCLRAASLYFACIANGKSRFFDSLDMKRLFEAAELVVERSVEGLGLGHSLFVCRPA